MFEQDIKKVDLNKDNIITSKTINLDKNLDAFILISSKDKKLGELLLNKILDSIIDKIYNNNIHNKLGLALENTNSFLNTWQSDGEKIKGLSAVIGVLRGNDLFFSTIGTSSCYLINKKNEVVEITDKSEKKKEFGFILNGNLKDKEIIIFSNIRLLNYLSKDDLKDSTLSGNIDLFNNNIGNILKTEDINKNVGLISFQNLIFNTGEVKNISDIVNNVMKLLDNRFIKKIIAFGMLAKEKLEKKSKKIKNIVFLLGIITSFILLYIILSGVISLSQNDKIVDKSKENLMQARSYLTIASENTNNPEVFNLNIEKANNLVYEIKEKNLFLNDTKKILNDISLLNKQFNGVESFEQTEKNTIYSSQKLKDSVNVVKVNNKTFIINKKSIVGPIISGKEAKEYYFDKLIADDYFIDSITIGTNIVLLTKSGKIVNFNKSNFFSYSDVTNQGKWPNSDVLASYSSNIYLLNEEKNQIFKHKKEGKTYTSGIKYLKKEDSKSIGEILSIAIDGGIYILKKDLSIIKFFKSPKYRIEKIMLNKLPKNYNISSQNNNIKLVTRSDLNYLYMLLNKRILIFKPNTKRYQNVKSLTFLGQVEGNNFKIKNFHINHDGEIIILGDSGLYKLNFEIGDDDKLIIK